MITIFNRREVFAGFSMAEFGKTRDILSSNQIKYSIKVSNLNYGAREMPFGNFGENPNYFYQYYVYVHKKDFGLLFNQPALKEARSTAGLLILYHYFSLFIYI